jgi:hypothetical protein
MNPAVAIFQTFATQMIGYGMAGLRKLLGELARCDLLICHPVRSFLVYPT